MSLPDILDRVRQALRHHQPDQAERLACQGIDQAPMQPALWELLAEALKLQGKRSEALAAYQQVLRLRPEHPETLIQLGVLLAESGQLNEALQQLSRAVQLHPGWPQARHNLGVALAQAGRAEEAVTQLEEALRLQPGYAEAGYNLGNVLGGLGRRDAAIAVYRRALQQRPDHYGVLNNLGLLLQETNQPGEAVVLLRQATRLRPEVAEGHNNLGLALADLGRFDEAEDCYHQALQLNPRYAEAHSNLGCALKEQGRVEEALACFEMALCLDPQSRSTRYNRSLCLLQAGDWQRGWLEYESRWGRKGVAQRQFSRPRWDGSALSGKTILVWTEQGLGDTIQFVRFVPALGRLGGRTVLECPGYLLPLLSGCAEIDVLVAEGQPLPEYDVQVPLMSLPGLLGVTLTPGPWGQMVAQPERLPAEVPYLSVEPERVERWRQRLGGSDCFRVGVVWQGNPYFQWDRWRSVPLYHFQALAEVEGVELVSLQRTHGLEQLEQVADRFGVVRLGDDVDRDAPFVDTLAVLKCLDLVVCADTAVGHLAGAVGVPVWLALSAVSDWRWLRGRDDTPWYPSMRLFRQEKLGDWEGVFLRMAEELRRLVQRSKQGRTVRLEVSPGELLDRLSILRIKSRRIGEEDRLRHVQAELAAVERACREGWPGVEAVDGLYQELEQVNERLWDVEDSLRVCERTGEFGEHFVELARSVYRLNDQRSELKRRISERLGAGWIEQKQYGGPAVKGRENQEACS